jgi:hypothetical protein
MTAQAAVALGNTTLPDIRCTLTIYLTDSLDRASACFRSGVTRDS